jgi:hypothetical protein
MPKRGTAKPKKPARKGRDVNQLARSVMDRIEQIAEEQPTSGRL